MVVLLTFAAFTPIHAQDSQKDRGSSEPQSGGDLRTFVPTTVSTGWLEQLRPTLPSPRYRRTDCDAGYLRRHAPRLPVQIAHITGIRDGLEEDGRLLGKAPQVIVSRVVSLDEKYGSRGQRS